MKYLEIDLSIELHLSMDSRKIYINW